MIDRVKNHLSSREMIKMKNFLKELGISMAVSLICFPAIIIGFCTGSYIYTEQIEPFLKKKFSKE